MKTETREFKVTIVTADGKNIEDYEIEDAIMEKVTGQALVLVLEERNQPTEINKPKKRGRPVGSKNKKKNKKE